MLYNASLIKLQNLNDTAIASNRKVIALKLNYVLPVCPGTIVRMIKGVVKREGGEKESENFRQEICQGKNFFPRS